MNLLIQIGATDLGDNSKYLAESILEYFAFKAKLINTFYGFGDEGVINNKIAIDATLLDTFEKALVRFKSSKYVSSPNYKKDIELFKWFIAHVKKEIDQHSFITIT
jgi:hypothetical protein